MSRGRRLAVCSVFTIIDVHLMLSGLAVSTAASEQRGSGLKTQLAALMCGVCVLFPVLCGFFQSAPVSFNHPFNIYPDK